MNAAQGHGNCRPFFDRPYAKENSPRQTYDLVLPRGASGRLGLVFCIHGGGWAQGDKSEYRDALLEVCQAKGVAAAALNYRFVSNTVGFADMLDDITAALAAIRAQGAACGVDLDRVLLTGISAGGHLSLLYAYARKDAAPIRPVCAVTLCGPADLTYGFYYNADPGAPRIVDAAYYRDVIGKGIRTVIPPDDFTPAKPALADWSPINYVDETAVPTVFGHGEEDAVVPYRTATELDAKLTACRVPHTFISFPQSGHGCEDKAALAAIMRSFFACVDQYLKSE